MTDLDLNSSCSFSRCSFAVVILSYNSINKLLKHYLSLQYNVTLLYEKRNDDVCISVRTMLDRQVAFL